MTLRHRYCCRYLLLCAVAALAAFAFAAPEAAAREPSAKQRSAQDTASLLDHVGIIKAAVEGVQECIDYHVIGVCLWLSCGPGFCDLRVNPWVQHYVPDLVVTASSNRSPWGYAATLNDHAARLFDVQGGAASSAPPQRGALNFKRVEVIGNPAGLLAGIANITGLICSPATIPYVPNFLSSMNILGWRRGIPDMLRPSAWLPGARGIGVPGELWGELYPRIGFSVQVEDPKAAFVAAFRAAHIVSRPLQGYVYWHPSRCGKGCDAPGALRENKPRSGKWQQLLPPPEEQDAPHCAFVNGGERLPPVAARYSQSQQYAWNLWRPYRCCKRVGKILWAKLRLGDR